VHSRSIMSDDLPVLQAAIDDDKFHPGQWKVEDFRGFSELFEDGNGIIVFVLYTPEAYARLRISTMWVDPDDTHRNGKTIIFLVMSAAERAAKSGFKELIFTTTHDKLANFCIQALKFRPIGDNQYVLDIQGR
jgi:hypothetical protein